MLEDVIFFPASPSHCHLFILRERERGGEGREGGGERREERGGRREEGGERREEGGGRREEEGRGGRRRREEGGERREERGERREEKRGGRREGRGEERKNTEFLKHSKQRSRLELVTNREKETKHRIQPQPSAKLIQRISLRRGGGGSEPYIPI